MRQVVQQGRDGTVWVADVPEPRLREGHVLVRTAASLISPGTERLGIEFGRRSLLGKAYSRPDLVLQVVERARRDGLREASRVALGRLAQASALGYACAGRVLACGGEDTGVAAGEAVACAGAGYAIHAEVNCVPKNLTVRVPGRGEAGPVPFEEACFGALGAIALHGVRLGRPGVGERVVVIGLGLVGLLATQVLRAHGCAVLGVDPAEPRRQLAEALGVAAVPPDRATGRVLEFTGRQGADVVVIAAGTKDSEPIRMAGEVARDRARVVAIGATGLDLPRRTFYRKELSVVVSRSYGPGRYDPNFEERGQDYPAGYVRWTERENLRAFLELVASGQVRVAPLITHRVPIADAAWAYELLGDPTALGIVLQYPEEGRLDAPTPRRVQLPQRRPPRTAAVGVSVIGAGSFARDVLLPVLRSLPSVELRGVVTNSGLTARNAGDRFGFRFCASESKAVWEDDRTDAVIVATRHDLHARLVRDGVAAGKAVFVEKPLCLDARELQELVSAHDGAPARGESPLVMVGFNRRFAPAVVRVRAALGSPLAPRSVHYRVNAGPLPEGSWIADPREGGGRIVGEMCHFVDLCTFLVGCAPSSVFARSVAGGEDDVVATFTFRDGSLAVVGYYSGGDRAEPKERIELFGGGSVAVIEDFRAAWITRGGRRHRIAGGRWASPEKGHREELEAFVAAVRQGGPSPVPFADAVGTTAATLGVRESLRRGAAVDLGP